MDPGETQMNKLKNRVALREEGEYWNAYLAQINTMEDSLLVASIRLDIVYNDPIAKNAFMELAKHIMKNTLESIGAEVTRWDLKSAPDHEKKDKSGKA